MKFNAPVYQWKTNKISPTIALDQNLSGHYIIFKRCMRDSSSLNHFTHEGRSRKKPACLIYFGFAHCCIFRTRWIGSVPFFNLTFCLWVKLKSSRQKVSFVYSRLITNDNEFYKINNFFLFVPRDLDKLPLCCLYIEQWVFLERTLKQVLV